MCLPLSYIYIHVALIGPHKDIYSLTGTGPLTGIISVINYRHTECAAAYQNIGLLCADLWQAGGGGEQSCGAVASRVLALCSLWQLSLTSRSGFRSRSVRQEPAHLTEEQ